MLTGVFKKIINKLKYKNFNITFIEGIKNYQKKLIILSSPNKMFLWISVEVRSSETYKISYTK